MKIRTYLVALVLSIFVPFTIFAGAIAYKLAEGERAASVEGLRSTARALAIAVDRNVADVSNSLKVLAAAELLRIRELEGFHRYARRVVLSRPELQRLVLVEADGRVLFDTDLPYAAMPGAVINARELTRAIATGMPAIGANATDYRLFDSPAITVFVPAEVDGEVRYALIAFLNPSIIGAIFADQKVPYDWTGVILDGSATILSRSRSAYVFVGQPAPAALAAAVAGSAEGVVQYETQEGRPTLAGFAKSNLTAWTVVIGMPVASAEFSTGRILTTVMAIGAAVSLLALALASFLGHQISRSVLGLLEPALAIARGDPITFAAKSGIAEIQRVSDKLMMASDVLSEREAQRRRAEERFRLASLAANDFIWEYDVQTGCAERSSNFYAAFGYAPDERVNTIDWWRAHLHPEDAPTVLACYDSALSSDRNVWSVEYRFRRADGSYAYVSERACVVRDGGGCARRVVGVMADVTARKLVERQLRRSEAHLARAQRVAAVGSWEFDLATGEMHWSDETFRIYGVTRSAFTPTLESLLSFLVEEDLASVRRPIKLAQDGHVPSSLSLSLDFRIRRRDGAVRILHREGEAVFDPQGRFVGLIGTLQDVTESRAAEAKRRELEQLLRHTQKMEALGQLTGGIAHDFNNLLAVIVGNLELSVSKQRRGMLALELVEASLRAAVRGAGLTRQLLAFARRQPLRPVCQDLRQLVQGMAPILEPALTEKVKLAFEMPGAACWTEIDGGQFEAALINLAINARDAMPDGGALTIAIRDHAGGPNGRAGGDRSAAGFIEVMVKDTGIGMTREIMQRAFEPFFTTKAVGKGSGLGLSIVYGFVRQSGGRVEIASEPGQGTAVSLFFPRAEAPASTVEAKERAEAPASTAEGKELAVARFESLRVLLVEDEAEVRETVHAMLGDLGATVIPAADGPAALEVLKSDRSIDTVITDIVMPGGMDGIALAAKANAIRPAARIVFMSGQAELDHRTLLAINDRPFLTKPFRRLELAAALGVLWSS